MYFADRSSYIFANRCWTIVPFASSDVITLVIPLQEIPARDIWYAIDGKHFVRMITVRPCSAAMSTVIILDCKVPTARFKKRSISHACSRKLYSA